MAKIMKYFNNLLKHTESKIVNYGFHVEKSNDEIVALLDNGEMYLVHPVSGLFRPFAGTIHITERHIDMPGQKCLVRGVKAPYTASYTEITWEE